MSCVSRVFFSGLILSFCSVAWGQQEAEWGAPNAIPAASAVIKIKDQVDVTVEIPGKIDFLNPDYKGGKVKKGDPVVKLISTRVEAELKELKLQAESDVLIRYAQAKLNTSRKRLKTNTKRNEENLKQFGDLLYPQEEIEELELQVLEGEAELEKSKQDKEAARLKYETKLTELDQYSVAAPMDGVVTDLHLKSVGSGVRQGDPIFTIVNLQEVTALLTIGRQYESQVTIGDKVVVRRAGGASQPNSSGFNGVIKTSTPAPVKNEMPLDELLFEGEIVFIVPKKSTDDKADYQVEAIIQNKFVNKKFLLREGSKVEAQIVPSTPAR